MNYHEFKDIDELKKTLENFAGLTKDTEVLAGMGSLNPIVSAILYLANEVEKLQKTKE